MGTSSIYTGYTNSNPNKNPLIPDDFDNVIPDDNSSSEPESDDENNESDTENNAVEGDNDTNWQSAKNMMSKVASGNSTNIRGAISKYVKSSGGSRSISRSSVAGVRTILSLGNFISGASTQGLKQTLEKYDINYTGRSTKEVLSDLINILVPSPNTREDAIGRKALVKTMEKLYVLIGEGSLDIEVIDKLNIDYLNQITPIYIENYIYERLINDLGSRIETNSNNSTEAVKIEQEIKEYINSKVQIVFKGKDLAKMDFTKKEVLSLYNQCYTIMEDLI